MILSCKLFYNFIVWWTGPLYEKLIPSAELNSLVRATADRETIGMPNDPAGWVEVHLVQCGCRAQAGKARASNDDTPIVPLVHGG